MTFTRVFICTLVYVLVSCNVTYKVYNTENELKSLLHTPCGTLAIQLIGKGNSKFRMLHEYQAKEPIIIYSDSLMVLFNGVTINAEHQKLSSGEHWELENNDSFEVQFIIEEGVFDGDTIAIFGRGYVQCLNDFVELDTVYYTFKNRLRIHGVNAL